MKKFDYEENGYNISQVNDFIDEVIMNTQGIIKELLSQREENKKLLEQVDYYKNLSIGVQNNYKNDLTVGESIRKKAIVDAEEIINNAKNNASIIINDALIENERLKNNTFKIESELELLKDRLKELINKEEEILKKIDSIKINNE